MFIILLTIQIVIPDCLIRSDGKIGPNTYVKLYVLQVHCCVLLRISIMCAELLSFIDASNEAGFIDKEVNNENLIENVLLTKNIQSTYLQQLLLN